ncbi:MAG: hypothetical protein P9L99_06320 [Candidatus Lernaella stagnicola]|nr:hypothetical protein [Candidatus Lernaella stagnicola]
MIVKLEIAYLPEYSPEMGKRFKQEIQWPAGVVMRGPYLYPVISEGKRALFLFEFDKARMGEAMDAIRVYPLRFYGMPGFSYSLQICIEAVSEARDFMP